MSGPTRLARTAVIAALLGVSGQAAAVQWQTTELHYQHGRLAAPTFAGGVHSETDILTLQHASGWGFGDLFVFADFLDDRDGDGFNDHDLYAEMYLNFSLGKLSGRPVQFGAIRDIGLLAGINYSRDARVRKWLPGVRLSWEAPGFAFLNTDFTLYLDDSAGVEHGGAPREDDSYMLDVNWAYPIQVGAHQFSIEGHGEYIARRTNAFGQQVDDWVLLQPQFRYDLGKTLFATPNRLFVGVEWQYWHNKLGDSETQENVVQALGVVRF